MSTQSANDGHSQRTVLIVEDDPFVRDVAVEMLKSRGFNVIEAEDARTGLIAFKQHPEIDLVFTDAIMPGGVSGIEMAKEILFHRPHTPILLATGYQDKARALKDRASKSDNIVAVTKPYDVNVISEMIDSMLARAMD